MTRADKTENYMAYIELKARYTEARKFLLGFKPPTG